MRVSLSNSHRVILEITWITLLWKEQKLERIISPKSQNSKILFFVQIHHRFTLRIISTSRLTSEETVKVVRVTLFKEITHLIAYIFLLVSLSQGVSADRMEAEIVLLYLIHKKLLLRYQLMLQVYSLLFAQEISHKEHLKRTHF